jgi:hypothetical protein
MIDTWAFNTELLLSEKMNKQSLLHCHFERSEKSADGNIVIKVLFPLFALKQKVEQKIQGQHEWLRPFVRPTHGNIRPLHLSNLFIIFSVY